MSETLRKLGLSRFAQRVLAARPALAAEPADPASCTRAEMGDARAAPQEDKRALREWRSRVVLRVMARDLTGRADLAEVCETMSEVAGVCINFGLKSIDGEDLLVVGMGK